MSRYHENMLDEMAIGPRWILRTNVPVEALAPSTGAHEVGAPRGMSLDVPTSSIAKNALPHSTDVALCQTCACAQPLVRGQHLKIKCLFIDERPIANDSAQSHVLAGAAGVLFNNVLHALQMQRGVEAYLASIVKTKSVGQATIADGKGEFSACLDCLKQQITIMQPAIIVLLGSAAAISLFGLEKDVVIDDIRGQIRRYDNIPTLVTYNPMHLLMHRKDKGVVWSDLCRVFSEGPVP